MKKLLAVLLMGLSGSVFAATNHQVKMLNHNETGGMVFEPAFVKAEVGDTVTFLPTNSGHWVQSRVVPEGAEKFLSEEDQEFTITLTHEGVYVYLCPPHRMMNMTGLIQVGAATNHEQAAKMVAELEKRANDNKGRLQKLFDENVK